MTSLAIPLSSPAFFTAAVQGFQHASNNVSQSVARLTSGDRIQNPGDDVAAFSIAVGLQSHIAGLRQASSNAAQGSSLLQVAAGGLTEINTLLDNLQTVAQQAASTSLLDTQRGFLQQQFSQYLDDIDTVVSSTSFNGINLLEGFTDTFQLGTQPTDIIEVEIDSVTTTDLFGVTPPDVRDSAHALSAQTVITTGSNTIQSLLSYVAGLESSVDAASGAITQAIGGITAAHSALADTDIPTETSALAQATLQTRAATAVLAQAQTLSPKLLLLLNPALKVA